MRCRYPIVTSGRAFGCGRCTECRITKRRTWTHRIMLEALQYQENCFLTLTYADEFLPNGNTLVPSDLQKFLKRLRKVYEPLTFRFFACGEYGEGESSRPHYHLILFGLPTCARGMSRWNREGTRCCPVCELYRKTWGRGNIYAGTVSEQSAAYTCGYVVKKMTQADDERLDGRHPEFARMSNRPGIGAGMMDEVASSLMEHRLEDAEDVPVMLRHGNKTWPLGKYLRRRLRKRIGREENAPQQILEKIKEEMRPLREVAFANALPGFKQEAFRQAIINSGHQKRLQLDARERRFRKREIL